MDKIEDGKIDTIPRQIGQLTNNQKGRSEHIPWKWMKRTSNKIEIYRLHCFHFLYCYEGIWPLAGWKTKRFG